MRMIGIFSGLILVAAALAAPADNKRPTKEGLAKMESLGWLEGSWYGTNDEGGEWEACYTSVEGGVLLSSNKEYRHGRVAMVEFEVFVVRGDEVVLTPYPFGKKSSAEFKLVEQEEGKKRAKFSCPTHDFPRDIVYERVGDDRLVIDVIGEGRKGPRSLRLDMNLRGAK